MDSSSSKAQYFYGLPRFESIPSNAQNGIFNDFNNENPLKRLRNNVSQNGNDDYDRDNTFDKAPIPSSYIPSIYFENTVPHPYLIFYNLHLRDLNTENGYCDEEPSESIITQLNKYFKVQDILSFASSKNDYLKISETWNNRFPDAKSSSFSPIREDVKIIDLQDIQSLHLLGFQLNATFFLIFKIEQDKDVRYYNMKLGPDSSDFDIHFLVLDHVDKSKELYKTKDGKNIIIYKHDLWLSLQLVEIALEDKSNLPDNILDNEYSGITFLEMEKRNPIPFIHFNSFQQSQFNQVIWSCENTNEDKSNVLFSEDRDNKSFQIKVSANQKYIKKINKIKSIVTSIAEKPKVKKGSNRINYSFKDFKCFFAYINKSAFLVTEQELKNENLYSTLNRYFAIDADNPTDAVMPFAATNQEPISKAINKCIISYRERLKCPLTYGDIVSSNHPLISELCTYNVINMMLSSADYINNDLNRNTTNDRKPIIRVVPIENDDIFFEYKDFKDFKPTETKSEIMDQWKKLSDIYPQIMPSGVASMYGSNQNKDLLAQYKAEDSPMFSCFYVYLKNYHASFYNDNADTFQIISKKTIDHLLKSKIGLNPIVTPIIHREFMQLCKTCCIHYFSNKKYNKPVNDILMRDIQTISEFKSRTSVRIIKDESVVEENAKIGAFPIKKRTFIKMLEMKSNKQIPDPSFDFVKDEELLEAISISNVDELVFHVPKYKYQFYTINNNKIIDFVSFTIKSYYQLRYIYISRGKVFSVGESGNTELVYGTCEALDTEMRFDNPIKGKFIDAVYIEENSCLIICYYFNKKYCFTGYDYQGIINECQFESKRLAVKSLVVISRTYFASFDGKNFDNFEGFCVFNYNPKERKVEFHEYSEKWRITENSYGGGDLFRQYLLNEANKKDRDYMPSFIGTQFTYGINTSTSCIYKYDSDSNCLINENNPGNQIHPKLNFSFGSNDDQDEENELLEKRIAKGSNDIIKSMLTLLPLKENYQPNKSNKKGKRKSNKEFNFSTFDIQCSLCELFPTPVVINNKIITRTSDNNLSFYSCDYRIYRVLTDQIYGFYVNTFSRMSLFAVEDMLYKYEFDKIHVALIVDTCGIGAKFSNMFFGTRFDEKDILSEDIWSGFSYSGSLATVVLLFRVSDTESIYNAVKPHIIFNDNISEANKDLIEYENYVRGYEAVKKDINPTIFFCKKDGVKYSIRLGFSPEIILNGIGSKSGSQNHEITFIGDNEFMSQLAHLRNDFYDFSATDDIDQLPNIINDSRKALKIAKMIITRYLSFHTFDHYPIETIEKYSLDVKPFIYNIIDDLSSKKDNDDY